MLGRRASGWQPLIGQRFKIMAIRSTVSAPDAAGFPAFVVRFPAVGDAPDQVLVGLWSGAGSLATPPAVGSRVVVAFNGFGAGVVRGYFVESGYLGVIVECDKRPAWHIKQNGDANPYPHAFGAELLPEGGAL